MLFLCQSGPQAVRGGVPVEMAPLVLIDLLVVARPDLAPTRMELTCRDFCVQRKMGPGLEGVGVLQVSLIN